MPTEDDSNDKEYLRTDYGDIKLVSDYTRLDFEKVVELDCFTFRKLFRDAFIDKLSQTDEGREYLESCWTLTQTEPEREKLRERYGNRRE